jgi:hypothetical protein
LCPRPGCERAVTRQALSAPAGPGPRDAHIMLTQKSCQD